MFNVVLSVSAAEVFTYIGYVIAAILTLMTMIIIHESGHYFAGKMLRFGIEEFSIGFGPKLFQRKNKKTGELFTLRAIPIGGYCAFTGEDTEENAAVNPYVNQEIASNGKRGILAPPLEEIATKKAVATVENEETPVVKRPHFNSQPAWKRLIVLFAGAFFNFLSAIFIITIYFTAYGQLLPVVVDVYDLGGYEQYFEEGDVVLAVNGKQVNIMLKEDVAATFDISGESAKFKVLRDGKAVTFTANKADYIYEKQILNEDGEVEQIIQEEKHGFGITYGLGREKLGFFRALGRSFGFCFFIVFKILASLGALITGKIGIESAGGTVTVIKTIADVSSAGFDMFLYVTAIISANLAVMNLLPIPALDGSRMLFTGIEMVFRKPVPRKIEGIIHTVGLIVLFTLVVLLDIFHLVST